MTYLRQPSNPINQAIGAFDAVDRIGARHRAEDVAAEERAYNRGIIEEERDYTRQQRADAARLKELDAEKYGILSQMEDPEGYDQTDFYAAQMALEAGDEDTLRRLPQRSKRAAFLLLENDPTYKRLFDPAVRKQIDHGINLVETGMMQRDWQKVVEGSNIVLAPQINRGTADDGNPARRKLINRFVPAEDGNVYAELSVTRQDGSSYLAPRTAGEGPNPNAPVKKINVEKAAQHMRRLKGLLRLIEMEQVALGDRAPLERLRQSQQIKKSLSAVDQAINLSASEKQLIEASLEAGEGLNQAISTALSLRPEEKERNTQVAGSDKAGRWLVDMATGEKIPLHGPIIDEGGESDGGKGKGTSSMVQEAKEHVARNVYNVWRARKEAENAQLPEGEQEPVPEFGAFMQAVNTGDGMEKKMNLDRLYSEFNTEERALLDKAWTALEKSGPQFVKDQTNPSPTEMALNALKMAQGGGGRGGRGGQGAIPVLDVTQEKIEQVPPETVSLRRQQMEAALAAGEDRLDEFWRRLARSFPEEAAALKRELEAERSGKSLDAKKKAAQENKPQSPVDVSSAIFTNLNKNVPNYGPYDIPGVKQALQGLDQIADFFFISPTKAMAADTAGLLRDFQAWAQAGGFSSKKQAVEAYAKEQPEKAQRIAQKAPRSAISQ